MVQPLFERFSLPPLNRPGGNINRSFNTQDTGRFSLNKMTPPGSTPKVSKKLERWEEDIVLWKAWMQNKSLDNQRKLLKALDPIINSEVQKQLGTIPPPVLKIKAKKLVLKALPKYNPKLSRLSTFIVNQLKPLIRENMKAQNAIRLPENMQLKVREFMNAKEDLREKFNREATSEELADHLSWPLKKVVRMEKQLHTEASASSQIYEGASDLQDSALDLKIDLVYRSLAPRDKLIFEYTTGYGGKAKISNNEIAKKLGVSAAYVSQRKKYIASIMQKASI